MNSSRFIRSPSPSYRYRDTTSTKGKRLLAAAPFAPGLFDDGEGRDKSSNQDRSPSQKESEPKPEHEHSFGAPELKRGKKAHEPPMVSSWVLKLGEMLCQESKPITAQLKLYGNR